MKNHDELARAMTALSHPRRVALFETLLEAGARGLRFDELQERTRLNISILRHHLRPMQAEQLVVRKRRGVNVVFRLNGLAVKAAAEEVARNISRVAPAPIKTGATPPLN